MLTVLQPSPNFNADADRSSPFSLSSLSPFRSLTLIYHSIQPLIPSPYLTYPLYLWRILASYFFLPLFFFYFHFFIDRTSTIRRVSLSSRGADISFQTQPFLCETNITIGMIFFYWISLKFQRSLRSPCSLRPVYDPIVDIFNFFFSRLGKKIQPQIVDV